MPKYFILINILLDGRREMRYFDGMKNISAMTLTELTLKMAATVLGIPLLVASSGSYIQSRWFPSAEVPSPVAPNSSQKDAQSQLSTILKGDKSIETCLLIKDGMAVLYAKPPPEPGRVAGCSLEALKGSTPIGEVYLPSRELERSH